MKRIVTAVFNGANGTVSIVTTRKGKRRGIKFWSTSKAVNYCKEHKLKARMIAG